jgi:hypothetical protein
LATNAQQPFEVEITTPKSQTTTTDSSNEDDNSKEILKIHQWMHHISFAKLKEMAKQGIIPTRLAKCATPLCSSCAYTKITKKRQRDKPTRVQYPNSLLDPGEVVLVDQMVSPTHGFIAQMTGKLTTTRYKYATIYVDQASRPSESRFDLFLFLVPNPNHLQSILKFINKFSFLVPLINQKK